MSIFYALEIVGRSSGTELQVNEKIAEKRSEKPLNELIAKVNIRNEIFSGLRKNLSI